MLGTYQGASAMRRRACIESARVSGCWTMMPSGLNQLWIESARVSGCWTMMPSGLKQLWIESARVSGCWTMMPSGLKQLWIGFRLKALEYLDVGQ
jgi:hypothetical protein